MSLLLFINFRDYRGVLLPFMATGMATIWTMGILVLMDHDINIVNNAIVILLMVIGVADGVHVVALRFGKNSNAPVNKGTAHAIQVKSTFWSPMFYNMLLPCLTTTTTAVGFLSTLVYLKSHSSRFWFRSGHRRDDGLCHDHSFCTEHARHTPFATTRKRRQRFSRA